MERSQKYLKATIKSSAYLAIFTFLLMSLKYGLWGGIISGIVLGVVGAIVSVLLLIPLDFIMTRKLPPEALNLHQEREIQVKGDIEQVFNSCLDILKGIDIIRKVMPDKEKMLISTKTKPSWKCFGENITLQCSLLPGKTVKIFITSRPADSWAMVDYGKNFKNIEIISNAIADKIK